MRPAALALVSLGLFLLTLFAPALPPAAAQANNAPPAGAAPMKSTPLVEGNNHFALDLYGRLRSGQGNLFFSPSSISIALGMTYAGARGRTEAEMAQVLHFPAQRDQLAEAMHDLLASWQTTDKKQGFRLNVANRLWGQEKYRFLPAFLEATRTKYGAELSRLDFNKPEAARQIINQWVEAQTQDKIKDLIPSADLLLNARLVLTNAVYFKGDWSAPFIKTLTREEDFSVSAATKVKAPLMHRQGQYRYSAPPEGLQVLDLPYGDGSLSMVVLLPRKVDGLADLETKLTPANLQKWLSSCSQQQVVVYLPKFKTTGQLMLKDTLSALGMPTAFDEVTADFSGMTGNKELFISAVVHKGFVDVNEEGTEAAAATGVIATTRALVNPATPPLFRADHPFVFLIRDNRNGSIVFLGRLADLR